MSLLKKLRMDLERPVTRAEILSLLLGSLIFGTLLFLVFRKSDSHPLPAFLVGCVIGVILHELAHAIGCVLVGGWVEYIQLGQKYSTKPLLAFRFIGFNWHIYALPFSGLVRGWIAERSHYRARQCFFIAMGPFCNAALALIGLWLFSFPLSDRWGNAALGWTGANALLFLMSVIPATFRRRGKSLPNDAKLFWKALCYTDSEIDRYVESAKLHRRYLSEFGGLRSLSISELIARHTAEPADLVVNVSLLTKLQEEEDSRYLDFLVPLLDNPKLSKAQLLEFIDIGLTHQLNLGPPDCSEKADRLSARLLADNDSISVRGTRGSVLIDIGSIEEGRAMLEDVLIKTTSTIDKCYSNIFLALAAKSEGNTDLARSYAAKAAEFDPDCPALKRVADLLEPGQT